MTVFVDDRPLEELSKPSSEWGGGSARTEAGGDVG